MMLAQAALGLMLLFGGGLSPARGIHFLYGSLTV
jgi:hypothetical protein